MKNAIRLCLLLQLFAVVAVAQEQQLANIGDLKLQNGGVIRNCRIGYRTFGKLAADRSNVIVFPTWASGTTEQLKSSIGPGKLIDSSLYFVVAIDTMACRRRRLVVVSSHACDSRSSPCATRLNRSTSF